MIAKAVKGRGFRGALEYDLRKDHARVIDTNMNGSGPRELAAEFGEIRRLRPGLNKAVLHVSLSAAPGERLTDAQWISIGRRYLEGMGLDRNQYILTRHTNTDHEHVHLLANRIQFDGAVTSDSHDYRRQEALMRAIEHDLGLRQLEMSRNCERRAASKGEIEEGLRTGCASTRQQLQQLCDAAIAQCLGFAAYAARLEAAGVELVPVTQLEGTKLSGLSYRLDGVTMKGSDLGKRYSPSGLAKHGVTYDKERDHEAVSRCLERRTPGQAGTTAAGAALGADRECGAAGVDAGTVGPGDGSADRRIARDVGCDRGAVQGTGSELQESDRCRDAGVDPVVGAIAASDQKPGRSGASDHMAGIRVDDSHRTDDWSARERILALAGSALNRSWAGNQRSTGGFEAVDFARAALGLRISSGAGLLDVLRLKLISGDTKQREWNVDEVLENIALLNRRLAKGHQLIGQRGDEQSLLLLESLVQADLVKTDQSKLASPLCTSIADGALNAWVAWLSGVAPVNLRQIAVLDPLRLVNSALVAVDRHRLVERLDGQKFNSPGSRGDSDNLFHVDGSPLNWISKTVELARSGSEGQDKAICQDVANPGPKLKGRARGRRH